MSNVLHSSYHALSTFTVRQDPKAFKVPIYKLAPAYVICDAPIKVNFEGIQREVEFRTMGKMKQLYYFFRCMIGYLLLGLR